MAPVKERSPERVRARGSRSRRARAATPAAGAIRRFLAFEGQPPSNATLWLIGYAALFLVRPWEVMVPSLEVFRLETVGILILLVRCMGGRDAQFDLAAFAPILALVGSMLIVSVTSFDWAESYETVEQVIRITLFAACAVATLRTAADLRAFCFGWIAIMAAYEFKAVWEYVVYGRGSYMMGLFRMIGIEDSHGDPNTFAGKAVLLVPFMVLIFTTAKRSLEKWFVVGCFALGGAVVVLTGSRGAMLCAVFAGLLYLLFSRRRFQALALALVVGVLAAVLLPDSIRERYETLLDPESNESAKASADGRWIGMRKGIDLFKMRPVVGVGPGVFPDSSDHVGALPYEIVGLNSHNLLGQLLGEHGLVGAIGFGLFLGGLLSAALALRRAPVRAGPAAHFYMQLGTTGLISIALLLFQGIGSHNLRSYNWFWMGAVVLAGARSLRGEGLVPSPRKRKGGRRPRRRVSETPSDAQGREAVPVRAQRV